jgi:hypothetical protein
VHYARGAVARLHHFQDGVVVQGSAAFTSGASGGGLFDADRRLVGILMFRLRGAGPQYFSVPISWFVSDLADDAAKEDAGADLPDEPFWNRAPDRLPYFMRANMLMSEERWDDLVTFWDAGAWTIRRAPNLRSCSAKRTAARSAMRKLWWNIRKPSSAIPTTRSPGADWCVLACAPAT